MDSGDLTSARILIVDDEPVNVRLLERVLEEAGYRHFQSTTDPRRVLALYREAQPDLILLDLMMPQLDGVAVLEQLRAEMPAAVYLPILVLTADATLDAKRRALTAGARDFLTKPFEQFEVLLRIQNLLDTRRLYLELERHNRALEATVRERTERLLQSEKIATMGSLLAGVAHELNNPLAIVSGQTYLLQKSAPDAATAQRARKINDAATRCVRIVKNFLALARQRPPERTSTSLNEVVKGALELLLYQLRTDGVAVELDLAVDLPVVWADPHQLHQVLVNLIANAHQAMRRHSAPRRITLRTRHHPGRDRVRLEVVDTGPGIAPDVRAKIFEPFFTTKPAGEGTGLGLSLCRNMIDEHGGTLEVDTAPGRGARFIVDLPIGAPSVTTAAASDAAAVVSPKTILVVDDEPEVAAMFAELLEGDGHKVDAALNGAEALEALRRRSYDLVLTDIKMPALDGENLYEELRRRLPGLRSRVIFVTGDVLTHEKREFLERTGVPVLTKPCDLEAVRRLVQHVLAGTPG